MRLLLALDQGAHAFGGAGGDRTPVPDSEDFRVEFSHAAQGDLMLRRIEVERRPACFEYRVGGNGVAGEEGPPLGPPEGEVTRRVARSV